MRDGRPRWGTYRLLFRVDPTTTMAFVGRYLEVSRPSRLAPGGHVGYVGVFHDFAIPGDELLFSGVHLHGGPAPVRRFLSQLIDLI